MSYSIGADSDASCVLCEPVAQYSHAAHKKAGLQQQLFGNGPVQIEAGDIRVVELFAGVGGFRIGLERASRHFRTVWSNQWEPATKRQDASIIYCKRFGAQGHSNEDITTIPTSEIPDCELLCGGFPCQDYSVAATLQHSGGIEGKKGVLWWQIYRILTEKGERRPDYLILENVDRLLNSPASQRGRDFAIILSSLSSLGYVVEWRVINAAEYGMPQRRRRTYMVAYRKSTYMARLFAATGNKADWLLKSGILPQAFPCVEKGGKATTISIGTDLADVSSNFNKGQKNSPFHNAGVMWDGQALTLDTAPAYTGRHLTLGEILVGEDDVPDEFFIPPAELPRWEFQKGAKSLRRINKKTGFEYNYSEGAMAFPDRLDCASRTIITGEGGASPSRFKHVIRTASGRYRRLVPVELERLNMFPDNHTAGSSDLRRAFLMGNALVTGIVEDIALALMQYV